MVNIFPEEDVFDQSGKRLVPRKHCSLEQLLKHGLLTGEESESLFKFASVRNPFDSLVSSYLKKRIRYQPLIQNPDAWVHYVPGYVEDMEFCRVHNFEDWICRNYERKGLSRFLRPQSKSHGKLVRGVDFLIRYENLEDDLNRALEKAGVKKRLRIPVFNKTPGKEGSYHDHFTPKARQIVEKTFSQYLSTYQYEY